MSREVNEKGWTTEDTAIQLKKTKCLLYCTMAKPYLFSKFTRDLAFWEEKDIDVKDTLNGTIVCECEVECDEFEFNTMSRDIFSYWYTNGHEVDYDTTVGEYYEEEIEEIKHKLQSLIRMVERR